ncbi:sigma-54 interaction domain-containing protein [Bacillus sp. T33-2]|uniref:sigma-54 interaction domain-containing protein n=1 Tax=Bacillus sp. T33-2 TaxID=2054168 RepID=UPI000C75FDE2|nr:sigma 54-interacting transcriptional regulator [Bacillus sp. T33-2]PLR98870.1 sigma-54-dependent Fis family transcriptional regulator [Bacillus sp. T33-2]
MNMMSDMTKEVLSAILKSIDEAIHVVNTDGITIFYNEVAARHDGLDTDEVVGKKLLDVFPSLNEKTSTLLNVINTKKPLYNQSQSFVNLHGRKIETLNTTLPIFVEREIIGAVEIAKDYTRIKGLAEKLVDIQRGMKRKAGRHVNRQTAYTFADLLTVHHGFKKTIAEARRLAESDSPILVFGESGTGKELFVQGMHNDSGRAAGPFIAQNCAAIPETLLESILFGTSKGSYTGAVDRPGLFELANGGTLFLDELHAMPIELQAKLLRVLEDGLVRRVGSTNSLSVDVRVISAMNIHPSVAMEQGKLRADLFYRLNVLTFELLPLRDRKEDIVFLSEKFISDYNDMLSKNISGTDMRVKELFSRHEWPGNVRELKHTIEYMMNVCEGNCLTFNDLPVMLKSSKHVPAGRPASLSLKESLRNVEMKLIMEALSDTGGNIQLAAGLLGIPRQTLQYKMKKLKS